MMSLLATRKGGGLVALGLLGAVGLVGCDDAGSDSTMDSDGAGTPADIEAPGGMDDTTGDGCVDTSGQWVMHGWLTTQEAYYGYLTLGADLSAGGSVDLSSVIEFEGDFGVNAFPDGTIFVGQEGKSTIEKWGVNCGGALEKLGEVSLLNQGVTSTLGSSRNFTQLVSATKAYYFDNENHQVIVFNPETMTTAGATIDLSGQFGTPGDFVSMSPVHRDGDTFIVTARFWNEDYTVKKSIIAAFIDSANDTVTFAEETRCGDVAYNATDTAGNLYLGSHVDNAMTNNVPGWSGSDPSDSCIVRIKAGERDFDPDYYVNMDEVLGGGIGTTLIDGAGDLAYIMKYEGPAMTEENHRAEVRFGENWDVYAITLGDEANSVEKVDLPGRYVPYSGGFVTSVGGVETTFLRLNGSGLESGAFFQMTDASTAVPALEFVGSMGTPVLLD